MTTGPATRHASRDELPDRLEIPLTLVSTARELGELGCALRYDPGTSSDPWDRDRPESWIVYDLTDERQAWPVGVGVSWTSAFVDALVTLGALEQPEDGELSTLDPTERRRLLRLRDLLEALTKGKE